MMRLPKFAFHAPRSLDEAARILAGEGAGARVVAGGTDLYPNMKRRHQTPHTLVSLRRIPELNRIGGDPDNGLRLGAGLSLTRVANDPAVRASCPALTRAIGLISTPILRNMGTIGGNLCLDTRCNYYNQSYEWRRAIDFCMKCDGSVCWVAPSSNTCLAINSSDSAPLLCAIDAKLRLVSAHGDRELAVRDLYRRDGIDFLAKETDEIVAEILLPPAGDWMASYRKLRRREAFDFPVLGVATAIRRDPDGTVTGAAIYLNAVASAPLRAEAAEQVLTGGPLNGETAREAAGKAAGLAKPVDNADFHLAWRKRMARVFTERALSDLMS
jgi:4-hydroxybenzoyl-CoA reductase subunit beta